MSRLVCQIDQICLGLPAETTSGAELCCKATTSEIGAESNRLPACYYYYDCPLPAVMLAASVNTFCCWRFDLSFLFLRRLISELAWSIVIKPKFVTCSMMIQIYTIRSENLGILPPTIGDSKTSKFIKIRWYLVKETRCRGKRRCTFRSVTHMCS